MRRRAREACRSLTPAKLPFEPTGWKTVLLDHFSMQVADYQKEAAYFAALMNWKIHAATMAKAVLDIVTGAGSRFVAAIQPPAQPARRQLQAAGAAAAECGGLERGAGTAGAWKDAVAVADARPPAKWSTRSVGSIAPWNEAVEAELKKRG